jgi:iron(III) transport system permease protein
VTWRVARAGVLSTALMLFILSMSDLASPLVLGGDDTVLTTAIFASLFRSQDPGAAAAIAVALLVPCLVTFAWKLGLDGTKLYVVAPPRMPAVARPAPAAVRWVMSVFTVTVLLGVAMVYIAVPLGVLVAGDAGTGAWPVRLVASLALGVASGLAGVVVSLAIAACVASTSSPAGRVIAALGVAPLALPGAVMGLGDRLVFGSLSPVGVLVLSVVFWRLPFGVLAAVERMKTVERAAAEVAESLGADTLLTLRRITLPPLSGAAASIFVDFFASGLLTIGTVVFVSGLAPSLAAVTALLDAGRGPVASASALATGLVVVATAAVLLRRIFGRRDHVPLFAG